MLRKVCFKNFVKFKDYQLMDFHNDGPSIFIGENGSGKSAVLEGIRRCLKPEKSTSVSSIPDPRLLSYFICNYEEVGSEKNRVICGFVAIPEKSVNDNKDIVQPEESEIDLKKPSGEIETNDEIGCTEATQDVPVKYTTTSNGRSSENKSEGETDNVPVNASITLDGNSSESKSVGKIGNVPVNAKTTFDGKSNEKVTFYKFAMQYSETTQEEIQPLQLYRLRMAQTGTGKYQKLHDINDIEEVDFHHLEQKFIDAMDRSKRRDTEEDVTNFLKAVFDRKDITAGTFDENSQESNILDVLSNQVVCTFPLRSIGPLQWSESNRIHPDHRDDNYLEAEKRCEIIKCYLEDKQKQNKIFDNEKEETIFEAITQTNDYRFELKNKLIHLSEGNHALLKTPEGILEAKAFSILMSSIYFKTIILEEPDRGMHPQFIARMVEVIKQNKKEKRVILTTHNTSLVTPWSLPGCFVFRREGEKCRVFSGRKIVGAPTHDNVKLKKLRMLTYDHVSDILFATKVLFFEGASEMLFLTELKEQILQGELKDIDIFKGNETRYEMLQKNVMGLSLVQMNGKGNAINCHNLCIELGIKHLILVDKDFVTARKTEGTTMSKIERKEETENEKPELRKERQTMMTEKRIFFWLDGEIEDMLIDICDHNDKLLEQLEQQNVTLNREKYGLKKRPAEKLFLRDAVTLVNIHNCVKSIAEHCQVDDDLHNLIKCLEHSDLNLA